MMEDELPQESAPDVIDNRPLNERIADKNWKTRNTAYENLKTELQSGPCDPSVFSEYGPFLSKMTADANAGALDTGLDTSIAFVEVAPVNVIAQYADKLFANVVDKAFGAKASSFNKGKTLLLKLMEVDEPTSCCTFLLTKLADKKPKIPPACLDVIREGIVLFGLRVFPVKEIIKALAAVFNGTNGPARESAMNLIVEVFRWVGVAPLQALLDSIRSAQKSDFEKIIAEKEEEFANNPAVPTLYLRKSRPAPGSEVSAAPSASGKVGAVKGTAPAGMDGREFVDEIDLAKKLRATDFATLVAEEKWSEQLKGLQLVIDAIGPVPKIKAGTDVHDIVAVCKGFLRQGHVLLQVSSLKILTLLADGLRSDFGSTVRPMVQVVVQKAKEKKLVPEVHATLHMVLTHCLSFDSMAEDVAEMVRNKKNPPHSKIGMMEFLAAAVREMPEKISADSMKPLAEALISVCEDPDPKVRDVCGATLGALTPAVKAKGRFAADAYKILMALEQSAPKVFKKMQNAMQPAAGDSGSASAKSSSTGVSAHAKAVDEDEEVVIKPKASALPPKKATSAPSASTSAKSTTSLSTTSALPKKAATSAGTGAKKAAAAPKDTPAEDDNVEDLSMSPEEAQTILESLGVEGWDSTLQTNMASSKWQDKVDALGAIERRIVETKTGGQYSAALVKYLSVQTNGFKISNMNILKAVIQTACAAATNCGSGKFSKPAAWELLRQFGDKLSDRKTKEVVETLLTAFGETISPSFVVKRMKVVMDKIKAPVAHQYFLEWLKQAIHDFGFGAFPVPLLGAFCQTEMDNKIAAVRSAAVEVMGALYHQIGPRLLSLAISDDMKPALKALLEAEFAKVGHDPSAANKATRAVNGETAGASATAIPRQDLSSAVDKNILSELGNVDGKTSWQNRKAAMEAIIAACERSGHYLEANKATGEIVKALKVRINDTQANLKPIAVTAIGHIIASLEPDSANKVLKIVASGLMSGLADNKKGMRDSTVAALHLAVTFNKQPQETAVADPVLLTSLLPSICEALANSVGRQELLHWVDQCVESLRGDCGELMPPLVLALQDKTAEVRALAERVATNLLGRLVITRLALEKATRDLPPATKRSMQPAIDRMAKEIGTKKASSAPAAKVEVEVVETADEEAQQEEEEEQEEEPVVAAVVNPVHHPYESVHEKLTPFRASSSTDSLLSRKGVATAEHSVDHESISIKKSLVAPRTGSSASLHTSSIKATSSASSGENSHRLPPRAAAPAPKEDDESAWALRRGNNGKQRRHDEFGRLNWPMIPGEQEYMTVKAAWEPLMGERLASVVFPEIGYNHLTMDSFDHAFPALSAQLDPPLIVQHTDLALRWCSCVLAMHENSEALKALLLLLRDIFVAVRSDSSSSSTQLSDSEINIIIPHLVEKSGHRSEQHRENFARTISIAGEIIAPVKIAAHLVQGLQSLNKRSRMVCLEELQKVAESAGAGSMGRFGMKEVVCYLDSKDCDTRGRHACLELIYTVYLTLECNQAALNKLLGDVSERVSSLIADRLRQKVKRTSCPDTPAAASTPAKSRTPAKAAMLEGHALMLQQIDLVMATTPIQASPPPPVKPNVAVKTLQKIVDADNLSATGFKSPPTKGSRQSMIPVASPVAAEYESLYADIGKRVERLLAQRGAVRERDSLYEEAKDYIKMLHSIVSGEWTGPDAERLPEDEAVLLTQVDALAKQMVRCVARSFDLPTVATQKTSGAQLGVDVSLLAISLSTLFAMVKRPEVVRSLGESTVYEIFHECLMRISDPRILYPTTTDDASLQTANQVVTAINMIAIKLAAQGSTSTVLCALLRVMFLCIPQTDLDHSTGSLSLPPAATKPTSRLIIKVLTDETEKDAPYSGADFDVRALLLGIHEFFAQHPANTTDDTPFRTVKTVLNELIKALGGQRVLSLLQTMPDISQSAFVYQLTSRLGNVSLPETHGELHAKIVSIIDSITSVRDKVVPIKELHRIRRENPTLDMNAYLAKISTAFRRFVLDTLARLDAEESGSRDENECLENFSELTGDRDHSHKNYSSASAQKSASASGAEGTEGNASEAMRILEGLKNRPTYYKQLNASAASPELADGSSTPSTARARRNSLRGSQGGSQDLSELPYGAEASPFAKRNDKIRDSLSSLTASLDLPFDANSSFETSDLVARLQQRLNK